MISRDEVERRVNELVSLVDLFRHLENIDGPFYIVGGAILWVEGLKDSYRDLDVWTPNHPVKIKKTFNEILIDTDPGEDFSLEISDFCRKTARYVGDGIYISSIEHMLNVKKYLNRPKDALDIELLTRYLTNPDDLG